MGTKEISKAVRRDRGIRFLVSSENPKHRIPFFKRKLKENKGNLLSLRKYDKTLRKHVLFTEEVVKKKKRR